MIERLKDWLIGKPSSERSPDWPVFRHTWLNLHPTCGVCGTRGNCEVHHILPVHFPGGRELELSVANVMTLCRDHHFEYGHSGYWKARNQHVQLDARMAAERHRSREYAA